MLKDEIQKYVGHWPAVDESEPYYIYNCAEAMLLACNDYYRLNIDTSTKKAISVFGGGFFCGKTCGLLSGGLASIGVMCTKDIPYANKEVIEKVQKWVKAFENEFGDTNCEIVAKDDQDRCKKLARRAAELFESIFCNTDI
ncbi:hypothetical protein GC105_15360 [Alkalibaculum sp. M08DMB]|uniref:C_GCAxxG_C_C family protein n=1 Tax=Alkalibaculum sporogenes TaxID=2655001 RepID=A0A6A7KCS6_9FIRM|nr:C-GCAxxG-C-C family protein [Alkalibaculum sporogenes]MPW27155.1 hypothetical protein [Alkalibaculum sporogenes]